MVLLQIEALDGLDTCVRIKFLYAQNNRIRYAHDLLCSETYTWY